MMIPDEIQKNYDLIDKSLDDNCSIYEISEKLYNVDKHSVYHIFDKKQFVIYYIKVYRPDKLYLALAEQLNLL